MEFWLQMSFLFFIGCFGGWGAEVLFRKESPVGKYVRCGDSVFQVVGVYNDDNKSNNAPAYIPFTVAQMLYNKGYGFGNNIGKWLL